MRRLAGAILATALTGAVAHAQDARACMERLSAPSADSVRSTFAATVQSCNPRRPLPATYAERLGEGVHQGL